MGRIEELDQSTINQIAAGEVIDRPASVVKELLENAIDAMATAVTVEIKDGGISYIRITDNGMGFARDDIKIAFLRHTTSKIRSVEDLLSVSSLGFRGEALSSIAAVAQVELLTKQRQDFSGTRYVIEGGRERSFAEVGTPDGTTFLIRNLFYNTPARRKFLKSATTEASYITEIVERIALSHPEISIRYIINGQNKLHTSGNHNLKDCIYQVFGREVTSNLIEVHSANGPYAVDGFLGKPVVSRGNRNFETYFINGRYIKSKLIAKAIEDAFQPYMMQHKYPFTVLHFKIDSELLDVNVHPSKMELRFENQAEIYEWAFGVISNALREKPAVTQATLPEPVQIPEAATIPAQIRMPEPVMVQNVQEHIKPPPGQVASPQKASTEQEKPVAAVRPAEVFETIRLKEEEVPYGDAKTPAPKLEEALQMSLFDETEKHIAKKPQYKIVGQVFDTYWIVEYENQMYIIDQHAAHEKILYERTLKSFAEKEYTSQQINPPLIIHLTAKEEQLLSRYMDYFRKIGFEIEHFGDRDYAIRAIPDNLLSISKKELFLDLIDSLSELEQIKNSQLVLERVASMSCKAAVKGNHRLSVREAEALINELLGLEQPFHCPHGRPTIITMSKYELEKKFKRIL